MKQRVTAIKQGTPFIRNEESSAGVSEDFIACSLFRVYNELTFDRIENHVFH